MIPPRFLTARRFMVRRLLGPTAYVIVALPIGAIGAQNVSQQGWNPKEILAAESYVKPPAVVQRIVTAPRNNVALTSPSPDRKYFLKVESEGLPGIEAFGKLHYRLGGVEIDPKASRARSLTTRGGVGPTVRHPL